MLTKTEIAFIYDAEGGLVSSAGKYAAQPWYVAALDGENPDDQFESFSTGSCFRLYVLSAFSPGDVEIVTETGCQGFVLETDDYGFVSLHGEFGSGDEARDELEDLRVAG